MQVLIIYPENQVTNAKPVAVALLSAILKKKGHTVDFIDTSQYDQSDFSNQGRRKEKFSFRRPNYLMRAPKKRPTGICRRSVRVVDEIKYRLSIFKPDVILVSAATIAFYHARRILAEIKNDTPVIYGGCHTIFNSESAINLSDVKIICIGEGEKILPELLLKMEKGEDYYNTPNFIFKDTKGNIFRNCRLPLEDRLDELPFMDYSIFDYNYHFYKVFRGRYYRMGDIVHARGCFNSCSFCLYDRYYTLFNETKHTIRAYSPERMIEEIEYLVKNYHLELIRFHSSDFLALSEEYINKFSRLYRKRVGLPNVINSSVSQITKDKAKFLRRMNCVSVSLGVESGNEEYRRKVLNKHFTNSELITKTEFLHSEGIRITSNNMVFLPEETRDMIFENINLHKKTKIDILDYKPFYPFPGLTITKYCIEKGLVKDSSFSDVMTDTESILKSPISKGEQIGLIRTIYLYKEFPRFIWKIIRIAENDTFLGRLTHKVLHAAYHTVKYGIVSK